MKDKLERWLIALFIVGSLAVFVWTIQMRPRILVLHSYGADYSWVRDVNIGLKRVLDQKRSYAVRWHYMDLKRFPWREAKENAGIRSRRVIDEFSPDVIIAVDDDAQEYAAKYYVNHPKIKIVFAGINGDIEPYGYDKASNATGILERKQLTATRDAIRDAGIVHWPEGGAARLLLIGDTSESVKSDMEHLRKFDWKPVTVAETRLAGTFDEWQEIIRSAPGRADVIITTNYRKLTRSAASRELVSPEEVVKWTEGNSKLPVIGTNGFYVEDGGMLAIGTSGYEQGEVAAKLATQIIDKGTSPKLLPVVSTSQFVVFMRPALLKSHNVKLPPLYEAFARANNNYIE
jgi:hypothetical protein